MTGPFVEAARANDVEGLRTPSPSDPMRGYCRRKRRLGPLRTVDRPTETKRHKEGRGMSEGPSNPAIYTRADIMKERERLATVAFQHAHYVMGLTKSQATELANKVRTS